MNPESEVTIRSESLIHKAGIQVPKKDSMGIWIFSLSMILTLLLWMLVPSSLSARSVVNTINEDCRNHLREKVSSPADARLQGMSYAICVGKALNRLNSEIDRIYDNYNAERSLWESVTTFYVGKDYGQIDAANCEETIRNRLSLSEAIQDVEIFKRSLQDMTTLLSMVHLELHQDLHKHGGQYGYSHVIEIPEAITAYNERDNRIRDDISAHIDLMDKFIADLRATRVVDKCGDLPEEPGEETFPEPKVTDLGTLGGTNSGASAINDKGQAAGWSLTSSGEHHAFLWTVTGGMRDLGTLGGTNSVAGAINNNGQVVGDIMTASMDSRATLWEVED